MKKLLMLVAGAMSAMVAMAAEPSPLLIVDYNRDGKIDAVDYGRLAAGETFTIWLNDDDDDDGTDSGAEAGDTNNDLHDVPGGEGNDRDCEDEQVNGRCDLLDFFPVLINVEVVPGWDTMTWKLISKSVNVVFTQLKADTAGDFHTKEEKALDNETPLYEAEVKQLAGDEGDEEVELPDGFLTKGQGVILVEGAALGDGGLTLRGEKDGSDPVEMTMSLDVVNVEDMFGWMNLRPEAAVSSKPPYQPPAISRDSQRHFILVHGYNTNPDEARGNAAEFYKKLYQSGSDAMFTAVEWRGDQSQIKFDLLGVNFSPNYHVNVENAFLAARPFADACRKLPGEKILVGHSLGNVLVSSAIKDYGLDYTKYVMLNAAVPREAYDASAYDEDMVPGLWKEEDAENRAARWYRNFADGDYRHQLAWRGRFANLPRTVNYYSPTDNILVNPDPHEKDPDKVFDPNDQNLYSKVEELLVAKLVNGRSIGSGGSKKTGFGFWSFSEKMKGTWVVDAINDAMTNLLEVAQADAYKCEGGWGENPNYVEGVGFDPANTRFAPFLDPRMKTVGMLDILPAETERLRAQHLADAIPAESFAAGANEVATVENVNEESFIGENPDWPLYEGEEVHTNLWNHSAFREVAFYHTSKFYASLAAVGKPRVIIDTDLGSSMDDLFTVDLAARMHKQGKLDLMAVMMDRPDKSDIEGEGEFLTFADRYLALLGFEDLPIGKAKEKHETLGARVFNPYWTLIYSNDVTNVGLLMPTNRTAEAIADLPDAVTLYRRLLNDAPDKSVVICSTGFLSNLEALMRSEKEAGDDIAITGMELIERKVKELRIMAGCFDPGKAPADMGGAEYNAAGDPVAANMVLEQWPTPVIVSPWEVGLELEYEPSDVLADFPLGTPDPVLRAAYVYWPEPLREGDMNRLWDPMTVLPIIDGDTLVPLSPRGGISVDKSTGVTTFREDASSNRYYQVASKMDVEAVMNRLREVFCMGNPLADTVVYGTIRTAEKDNPIAEAIAIKDGKYIYVGNEKGASKLIDEDTEIVDHRGKGMVMPGCTDGHSHYTMKFGMDNMKGGVMFDLADSKTKVLEKLEAATSEAKAKGRKTLFGFGWNIITLLVKDQPTLKELDDATGDISTVIFDQSGHHCFCNSECLKRCGIIDGEGKVLIDKIDGGVLELDENGYPTGLAEERVTGYLMRMGGIDYDEVIDDEAAEAAILETQKFLLSTGYTAALEGWSNMLHTNKLYAAAKRLDENGKLKLVFPMTYEVEPWQTNIDDEITYLDSLNKTYRTRHVLPEYLKVFMDGVVETRTGAMINPYKDGTVYKSFWAVDRLADITEKCNAMGLTVHTHVMGDAAIKETADAYIQGGDKLHRNCLVHLRNVRKEDFQRFAANNIACTAGFTWHISNEKEFNDLVSEFLDDEYLYHAYPMKSFFDAEVKVSSHSDFPANIPCPQDPFGIMEVAVTGQMPDDILGESLPAYDEDELVTRTRAFEALTLNGAWQLGLENERGSIKVGKWADFVIADRDIFECEVTDIGNTKVVSTWFEGEKVFEAPLGSKANPWEIGAEVTAYISGADTLVVKGKGAIESTPWAGSAAGITKLIKDDGVESTEALVKSLPALTNINGLTRDQFTSAAIGFVKADGFSAIEVTGGKATLDVVVSRAPSLDKPVEWTPVSTNKVEVSAPGEQGFFIVAPAE